LFDKNGARQGSGEAVGSGVLFRDRSKPLAFESVRAIFISPARAAGMSRPCKTFMRPKWRCKVGVPILMAEDGAPSLIFAME
jgi:hypothetical protein